MGKYYKVINKVLSINIKFEKIINQFFNMLLVMFNIITIYHIMHKLRYIKYIEKIFN